jgi:hypothetical protein
MAFVDVERPDPVRRKVTREDLIERPEAAASVQDDDRRCGLRV